MDIIRKQENSRIEKGFDEKIDYFSVWQEKNNEQSNAGSERKNFIEQKGNYQVYKMGEAVDASSDFSGNYYYRQVGSDKKRVDDKFESFFNNKKQNIFINLGFRKLASAIVVIGVGFLIFNSIVYVNKGIKTKERVLGISSEAYGNLNLAMENIKAQKFLASTNKFNDAYEDFIEVSNSLESLGKISIGMSRFLPYVSKLSSGYNLAQAGEHFSLAGRNISEIGQIVNSLKGEEGEFLPVLDIFKNIENKLEAVEKELVIGQEKLSKVKFDDIPGSKKDAVMSLKNELPVIISSVKTFSQNSHIIADLLGANGPRKYLFLFQNNQEMRATGGFIGSYGLLDITGEGRVRNFFIDGIFNPDGQLTDNIIPPRPLQKISGAWSLHDSNWFPNFPLSAEKAILFYEKTGGPTVDGVITLTPTVMQKLLRITGPIRMDDYDVTLTADNFIENIQYEVEEDYDKLENRPKKILSDLAPILMDKLFNLEKAETLVKTMNVLGDALAEKHILVYSRNEELQKIISNLGWSGEILETKKDYLSVINTNINGFKTDGIIEQKIEHQADIQANGSIIDTVKIIRRHNGGNSRYDWWNKVNSNYLRIYVPKGSQLISVEGQTPEIIEPPLDYKMLKFATDSDVVREETIMKIDEETTTRIYQDAGKTVFANWTYVSPGEEVVVEYKYLLPFKIDPSQKNDAFNSYSLLAQKQSGSVDTQFFSKIFYPQEWLAEWNSKELTICSDTKKTRKEAKCFDGSLNRDNFYGLVFSK